MAKIREVLTFYPQSYTYLLYLFGNKFLGYILLLFKYKI